MSTRAARKPVDRLAAVFAEMVERWARESGAPPTAVAAASDAAYRVSVATSLGHVCIDAADLDLAQFADTDPDSPDDTAVPVIADAGYTAPSTAQPDIAGIRALLLASGVVGPANTRESTPLILDAEGRLYLHRYFDYERRLALRLMARHAAPVRPCGPQAQELLRELFHADRRRRQMEPNWQQLAVALALTRELTIISGGPGTGKTTTLVNLLACLVAQDPTCRIALAAPTGKAAARMQDAIRERAADLPAALNALLPASATTVHRLLGARPGGAGFRHDARHPLPHDVVIVDEASMLDLALAARLLEALPAHARLVLCGDKDQLAAVEAGAVFAELAADPTLSPACRGTLAEIAGIDASIIVAPPAAAPRALAGSVIWLTENFRFAAGSGIGRLAAAINAGDVDTALAALAAGTDADVEWIDDHAPLPPAALFERIDAGYAAYVATVTAAGPGSEDIAAAFAAFDRFRVLCAVRAGARGADGLNRALERRLLPLLADARHAYEATPWYRGRPVMVLANDYAAKLYNGDVGLALPDADGTLQVWFADPEGGYRAFAPVRLPPHQSAFATTVHKAQGSEHDAVLVMLPATVKRVVTRELLYTALTRSRQRVTLAGGADVIASGIRNPTRRASGLAARLFEVAAGQGES